MFLKEKKFMARVKELEQKRYFGFQNIGDFRAMEGKMTENESNICIPEKIEGDMFQLNDVFSGRDRYLWIEKEVVLPEEKEGCDIVGLFDFGETHYGANGGFEAMLYVDGNPYQGIDTNHREVFFTDLKEKTTKLTFMLWTGMEGGGRPRTLFHHFKEARIGYLHRKTDELYYFSRAIVETLKFIDKTDVYYDALITALEKAYWVIDWDEDSFYETINEANAILMNELECMEKRTDITVNVVGHTHIDVAWLWRLKHTREKAQRSFSTVLRLMEKYDEYFFLQTSPQLYKYIKEDCPDIYEKIKKRIVEGRWEPDGGMWIEADCNLSSGESLVRQFLHGTRFFENEFGKKCEYLWLPDVFGYSWALPQILKKCGIDTFVTAKISWNEYNTIPDDLFKWKGIDGTEVLTYFIETPRVGSDWKERFSTYNGCLLPETVVGSWVKFKNKDLSKDVLLPYGYGDGGGGVNREMLELRRAMDKIPGLPNVKPTTAGEFFRKLHHNVDNTERYVHTWDGELYFEYHRGTYTTQAYNKKMNRYLENQLTLTEWLASAAYILGGEYAKEKIHDAWECVLLHQFHDIIPGSSVKEVYEDSRVNYENAQILVDKVQKQTLNTLAYAKEHTYSIYSCNSFGGKELVFVPEQGDGFFVDADGNKLESQKCKQGHEVLVDVVPFGVVTIIFNPLGSRDEASPFMLEGNVLDTPFYSIEWSDNGQLTKIFDKEAERNILKDDQQGNVLEIIEDKPYEYDAWNVDLEYPEKKHRLCVTEQPMIVENGSLKAVVRFNYKHNHSTFTQDMIVYKDSRRIDFKTHADWHEKNKILKVAFHTDLRTTKATYDIQFGHIERSTHWSNSWDWAKFEVCAHKWADISETGYGVSLLNDCKYGHSIKDGVMKLSLLRGATWPDPDADMGEHDFTYALYPHLGTVVEGETIEEANRLNIPAHAVPGVFADSRRIVKVSSENVQIDAIKKAEDEDCMIVRMHECRGSRSKLILESEYPIKQIVPCNLLEQECEKKVEGSRIKLEMKPFEIKTFKLYL